MRKLLLAVAMLGITQGAHAADMPEFPALRGSFPEGLSKVTRNWEGWYAGGQVGYSSADIDFSHATKTLTNSLMQNSILQAPLAGWGLLSKNHTQSSGFGGFVGRNYQWDDVILGFEANYNYMSNLASSSSNSATRAIVNPTGSSPPAGHTYTYNINLAGNAALQIKDVVTLRARAGWASGDFLPYMFGGLAVGRMAAARSVTIAGNLQDDYDVTTISSNGFTSVSNTVHHTDLFSLAPLSQGDARANSLVAGWTAGLGTEYMLFGNIFMRAEWEYVKFLTVKDMTSGMNTVRAGVGYKF